jgi:hypothetical protein
MIYLYVGCSAEGNNTVLGNGTPNVSANELLKNLSSALHQNGLFITLVPVKAAFLVSSVKRTS